MCNRLENLDEKFEIVFEFLKENEKLLSTRRKAANLHSKEGIECLKQMFKEPRVPNVILQAPTTIPDPAVSIILGKAEGYDSKKLQEIQLEHKQSMGAENKVGELLEMYLAENLEPQGWVWCSGNFVKSIDFIKKEEDGSWSKLQVKNRDNTENSSSSKVRDNTDIQKWHRTFSRKVQTNWENFPDPKGKEVLSEKGFLEFVEENVSNVLVNS